MPSPSRIYLSPPHTSPRDRELLLDAFDSNWIAPLGPHVDAFEREFARVVEVPHAVALSSGTAALHLALVAVGVQPGDRVIVPSLTFVATANAVCHAGASPVFVDSDRTSWAIDPLLVDRAAHDLAAAGTPARAVVSVDLFGQCADYDALRTVCAKHNLRLVADAAESLGASYRGSPAGSVADVGCFSFNGNKIITTSGGGMAVTDDELLARRIRHLACQSRLPGSQYVHDEVGYNYRLSNLLAALGRGQLAQLDDRVERRKEINRSYRCGLDDLPGVAFMPIAAYGETNSWLTCITFDPQCAPCGPEEVRLALEEQDIESRLLWKPLHLQPAHRSAIVSRARPASVAEEIWSRGLCLPSGSSLTSNDQCRVIDAIVKVFAESGRSAA